MYFVWAKWWQRSKVPAKAQAGFDMLRRETGVSVLYWCLATSNKDSKLKRKWWGTQTVSRKIDFAAFFVDFNENFTCLKEKVVIPKQCNLKRHYWTKHGERYEKYEGDKAKKDADEAVKASYMVSELIDKAGKPFTKSVFGFSFWRTACCILCPEKKSLFNNMSLSANTVAEAINELSSDMRMSFVSKLDFSLHTVCSLTKG